MKALVLNRYGGPEQVAFADIPRPALRPDEILVQVHAAGLNAIDHIRPVIDNSLCDGCPRIQDEMTVQITAMQELAMRPRISDDATIPSFENGPKLAVIDSHENR